MMLHSLIHRPVRPHGDPFATVQSLLNGAFGEIAANTGPTLSVRMDVKEDEKAFHVTADLPGLTEQEVDVTFEDGVLTVRGEKKVVRDEVKDKWHVVERSSGKFARQVALPSNVDHDKIEAAFEKGVLKITLPKAPEQSSAKKINIKAG